MTLCACGSSRPNAVAAVPHAAAPTAPTPPTAPIAAPKVPDDPEEPVPALEVFAVFSDSFFSAAIHPLDGSLLLFLGDSDDKGFPTKPMLIDPSGVHELPEGMFKGVSPKTLSGSHFIGMSLDGKYPDDLTLTLGDPLGHAAFESRTLRTHGLRLAVEGPGRIEGVQLAKDMPGGQSPVKSNYLN